MIYAVVPVRNGARTIKTVINNLLKLPLDKIVVIVNGCTDNTSTEVECVFDTKRMIAVFAKDALGPDIPRALGAFIAFSLGAEFVLFYDGDWCQDNTAALNNFIDLTRAEKSDLALTNCYPPPVRLNGLAAKIFNQRLKLNKLLNLEQRLGSASPSHGPSIISKRLFSAIPARELAVPPVCLSLAEKLGFKIDVNLTLPHHRLELSKRDALHHTLICKTIIGDHIEAEAVFKEEARKRCNGQFCYLGYHSYRRFDLLERFIAGFKPDPVATHLFLY